MFFYITIEARLVILRWAATSWTLEAYRSSMEDFATDSMAEVFWCSMDLLCVMSPAGPTVALVPGIFTKRMPVRLTIHGLGGAVIISAGLAHGADRRIISTLIHWNISIMIATAPSIHSWITSTGQHHGMISFAYVVRGLAYVQSSLEVAVSIIAIL